METQRDNILSEQTDSPGSALPAISIVLAIGIVSSCWMAGEGFPVPRGDDDFFKSPGAELAQTGRLAIPSARGFLPRAETVFACYPPLYQIILATWYLSFGFSLTSTLVFSHVVHWTNVLLMCLVANQLLTANLRLAAGARNGLIAAIGLIHLANVTFFDRPDETALIWIWIAALLVGRIPSSSVWVRAAISGLLVGAAALTVPWVGVLAAAFVGFRSLFELVRQSAASPVVKLIGRQTSGLFVAGAVAATLFAIWFAWMEWTYPGIMDEQFFMVLRYHRDIQPGTLADHVSILANTLSYNSPQHAATIVIVVFFPMFVLRKGLRDVSPDALAIYATGVFGILAVAGLRPAAYTYLGTAQMLLLPCFGLAMGMFVERAGARMATWLGWMAVAICVLVSLKTVAGYALLSSRLPYHERAPSAYQQVLELIPQDATVGVSYRHWYAFQGRYDWLNVDWCAWTDPDEVLNCEYLVLFPGKRLPERIDAFELIYQTFSDFPKNRTYAFTIWRRVDEPEP